MKLKENRPPEPAVVLALVAGLGFVYGVTDPNLADPTQVVRSAQASTAPQDPPPARPVKETAPRASAGSSLDFPRHVDRANCRIEEILDPDSRSMLTYHFREKQIRHRDGGKKEKIIPFTKLDSAGERHAKALQRELPKNCRTL